MRAKQLGAEGHSPRPVDSDFKIFRFRALKQVSLESIDDPPQSIMKIPWQQMRHIKINGRRALARDCLPLLARSHFQAIERTWTVSRYAILDCPSLPLLHDSLPLLHHLDLPV